jgi:CRP-like cAMP-binding protein
MPLVPLEQILFLKQIPLFRDIPGEEIAGLLPIVEEVEISARTIVLRQGDEGDGLYIIVEGRVSVEVDGRRAGEMGSRQVIGELAILTGEPRAATCTALSDVIALRIRRDPFWQLLRDHTEVSLGVIRILLDYLKRPELAAAARADGGGMRRLQAPLVLLACALAGCVTSGQISRRAVS